MGGFSLWLVTVSTNSDGYWATSRRPSWSVTGFPTAAAAWCGGPSSARKSKWSFSSSVGSTSNAERFCFFSAGASGDTGPGRGYGQLRDRQGERQVGEPMWAACWLSPPQVLPRATGVGGDGLGTGSGGDVLGLCLNLWGGEPPLVDYSGPSVVVLVVTLSLFWWLRRCCGEGLCTLHGGNCGRGKRERRRVGGGEWGRGAAEIVAQSGTAAWPWRLLSLLAEAPAEPALAASRLPVANKTTNPI